MNKERTYEDYIEDLDILFHPYVEYKDESGNHEKGGVDGGYKFEYFSDLDAYVSVDAVLVFSYIYNMYKLQYKEASENKGWFINSIVSNTNAYEDELCNIIKFSKARKWTALNQLLNWNLIECKVEYYGGTAQEYFRIHEDMFCLMTDIGAPKGFIKRYAKEKYNIIIKEDK